MEPILGYLKRKLRDVGPKRWPAISLVTGCSQHTIRKVAYGDIENPGVVTMQPLLDFFQAIDRGERRLPEPMAPLISAASIEAQEAGHA